ncbi:MAG: bifunctional phosphopantothenoylcysteine decarboxylase/phosphopantothenate--cysteine ligase CoaBC [Actinomycetota bacterium]|nr:bifunctional phosphopantothenoylcysteine decarboxylase/phosphopantothenate--cysteine ligase CoaBC [Actinomycetota bacterium]
MLAGRRIVLGVTGGVAAYKAAYLARRLTERGAEVRVVMTPAATEFIGTATFAALTGNDPVVDLFSDKDPSPHTSLAAWADVVVVAPATASTLSRLASGESSNALIATLIATTAPVLLAPAMHTEMWEHEATRHNVATLKEWGYHIVEPDSGELAGGDVGVGRLADPDAIVDAIESIVINGPLAGLHVIVTSGGTREAIDPVRYIGNRSSGKMGNAIARVAAARGATVTLVTAADAPDLSGVETVSVESADEMAQAVWGRLEGCDVAVMAAAVADFKPSVQGTTKIKRDSGLPTVSFVPTADVLKGVHESENRPFLVGFAAETGGLEDAAAKVKRKGVDLLVGNDVSRSGSEFGSDTNQVTLFYKDGSSKALPLLDKDDVAKALWDEIVALRGAI